MKYFLVIGFGVFIDFLQATISFLLGGFLGTIGGALGTAMWCNSNLPDWQWVQGACVAVGGAAGTFANPILVPIGIGLGFIINICLSLTMGAGLIFALMQVCGWKSVQKYLMPSFIGDTIPGINNLPFWTFLAIASSWDHAKQEGKLGVVGQAIGLAIQPTRAIMNMKEETMNIAQKAGVFRPEQQNRVSQEDAIGSMQKKVNESRAPMRDIRPKTT